MHPRTRSHQHGAASLIVVMVLLLVMLLTAAYSQQAQVVEQKASINQVRAAQAFEAAEAGQAWALAMLNGPRVDAQCQPDQSGNPLRERVLRLADAETGRFEASVDEARSALPACVEADGAWHCTCPAQGRAVPEGSDDDRLQPAFTLAFDGAPGAAGVVQITSYGCAHAPAGSGCDKVGDGVAGHAVTRWQAALVPALAVVPPAALTAAGNVDFAHAAVSLQNIDAATGLALLTGGTLQGSDLHITAPPGTPMARTTITGDSALAARNGSSLIALHLGMPASAYRHLPGVKALHCDGDCSAAAVTAWRQGYRMLYAEGDLQLDQGDIGSAGEPVLLVVEGHARFGAGVHLTGALLTGQLHWSGGDGRLRGAAVVAADVSAQGAVSFVYDAVVLRGLHVLTGTYVRVPGSWRDSA